MNDVSNLSYCIDEMIAANNEGNLTQSLRVMRNNMERSYNDRDFIRKMCIKIDNHLKMKLLTIFLLVSTIGFSQYGEKIDQMMGISPRVDEAPGCPYSPITSLFDSICYFESIEASVIFMEKITEQPKANFLFNESSIIVSGLNSDDPKNLIRVLGEIDKGEFIGEKEKISYRRLQCEDRSGGKMATVIGINETNGEIYIDFIYITNVYHYVVKQSVIPQKTFDVLDDIESLGYLYDGTGNESYTDEEVRTFLKQFGDPDIILSFMLIDLFTHKKHRK